MKLRDALPIYGDQRVYIGAESAFLFIGTGNDALIELPEISSSYRNELTEARQEWADLLESYENGTFQKRMERKINSANKIEEILNTMQDLEDIKTALSDTVPLERRSWSPVGAVVSKADDLGSAVEKCRAFCSGLRTKCTGEIEHIPNKTKAAKSKITALDKRLKMPELLDREIRQSYPTLPENKYPGTIIIIYGWEQGRYWLPQEWERDHKK